MTRACSRPPLWAAGSRQSVRWTIEGRTRPWARKQCRRAAGQYQRTFVSPLSQRHLLSKLVLRSAASTRAGLFYIETDVFTTERLEELMAQNEISVDRVEGLSITAENRSECQSVLEAALADSADFYFVPEPKPFLLYCDHHDYSTFFAHRKGPLSQLSEALAGGGFREVLDVRPL